MNKSCNGDVESGGGLSFRGSCVVVEKYIVFYVAKDQEKAVYVLGLQEGNEPIKITDVSEFVGVI